ncbi:hypothetical protein EKO27_g3044 [Xylaria grammica]|uniref:PH domain-containing protein n=1 Tax=Xylaria grammica TaxID=363999 RepID=A0A439DCC8_9PEZI|nr:hypothetical protein EKO27_g3044 [Xylaria grammica]
MELNAAQQILPEKQRRPSFSPMKAIRSLSISSQISHLSISSDTDVPSPVTQRRTLRKIASPGALKKDGLIRNDSTSTEDSAGRDSTSTQPTTPSIISRSTSIRGDPGSLIKSGALQPQSSILKPRNEYLVLTASALLKFRSRAAAEQTFPTISASEQGLDHLSPIGSQASLKDLSSSADISVPLEKIVSVYKGEGTRPSFGLEIWWKSSNATHVFTSLLFDFRLPDERDDWLKQIRQATKIRAKALGEERAPSEIEASFTLILDAKNENGSLLDIYPVIPRSPYTRLASEPKKTCRESSSFYLAFTKYSVLLAQFSGSSNGYKVNPSLVRFGLVTLSRVRVNVNDERFDLVFRISFRNIDFSSLSNTFDNSQRLESTIWLSRTGKRSLTRSEVDMVEHSSVLFQELISILLGSESIKHIDLTNVLRQVPTVSLPQNDNSSSARVGVCEIMPPVVLLWISSQTRCNSVTLSGNAIGEVDAVELSRVFQGRPHFLRSFEISRCNLDEASLVYLWEGLHEQRLSLEELDTSYNPGRIEASRIACTLNEASGLKRLNLAYSIRGELEGSLFKPWSSSALFEAWRLEELDLSGWKLNFETFCAVMKYLELEESNELRRLSLNNCALTGELVTGIFCRIGAGRDIHLFLNGNPLETGSTDWIDLIHGNEAPAKLHLDMIHFQHESTFNRLLTALAHNQTIEFLSMVGTGPPGHVTSKTSSLLSEFFRINNTLKFLDLSGYTGKLEDGQLGWGLSGALSGLKNNTSLHQLRLRNQDIDITELAKILVANKGLAMFDIQHNNFDQYQFGDLVQALNHNHQLISFPISQADREYAVSKEKQLFLETQGTKTHDKLSKSAESRLDGALTRLYTRWESEAKKAKGILQRNRDNPANQTVELPSEYLEAWGDEDLPPWVWLASKTTQQDKSRRRASELSIMTSVGDISPSLAGSSPIVSQRDSYPPHMTYVIEEER